MRITTSMLMACWFLASCASTPDGQKTQAQGTGAGALLGALVGVAITHDARGAAIGGAIGGAGGYAVGTQVAQTKAQYASREDALRLSAEHAQQLAERTRQQNEYLAGQVAQLTVTVQSLQTQEMSVAARRSLTAANRRKAAVLLGNVDLQLQQVRAEIARQQSVLATEAQTAQQTQQASPTEGVHLVHAAIRDLESDQRSLEEAKAQLQLIDPRRAY